MQTLQSNEANAGTKVLLMPLDVELSVLTASGMTELNAEWTENAKNHMHEAISSHLDAKDIQMMQYLSETNDIDSVQVQLEKLHMAVGYNVLFHHFGPVPLPNKNKEFDWTMGESAKVLKEETGADYAMFVFVRDSYASGGRVAMQIGMALLGVGVQGGTQIDFASVVDLNTGDLVWFNRLISTTGDLRELAPATQTVTNLLDTLPAPN
ncbi:hypothetical protein PN836_000275 [Ningiella sp. W23]|uniref:hypothetical protein n=1 Tax=Ningiella sp. W23 TaxID=3023715 RepID=UPI0037571D03